MDFFGRDSTCLETHCDYAQVKIFIQKGKITISFPRKILLVIKCRKFLFKVRIIRKMLEKENRLDSSSNQEKSIDSNKLIEFCSIKCFIQSNISLPSLFHSLVACARIVHSTIHFEEDDSVKKKTIEIIIHNIA